MCSAAAESSVHYSLLVTDAVELSISLLILPLVLYQLMNRGIEIFNYIGEFVYFSFQIYHFLLHVILQLSNLSIHI